MLQQQLSNFVSPVTQPLDDMHIHLSNLSVAYRDGNTKLRSQLDNLIGGAQGFQGNGATTFSSLIDYFTGSMEKYCQALDNEAYTAKTCSIQTKNAVDTASCNNLDMGIVSSVLSQVTLNDIILQGGSAIDPIMQRMKNTWQQMQNTWNDLQNTLSHEDKLMNDANNAADQEWRDLSSFNFGGMGSDVGRYWSDQWQKLGDWGHEGSDYLKLGGEGLQLLWDAIQLAWQVLRQWGEDIFQAVKNCLSTIHWITTTAIQDINSFISGIVKDDQTFINDAKKGDYTAALNIFLKDMIDPELKMVGLQQISASQIQEVVPAGLWAWLQSLPWWAWVAAITVIAAVFIGIFVARMFIIQAALSAQGITAAKGQIWSLLWKGYSNQVIEAILTTTNVQKSEGMSRTITNPDGSLHTFTGHTMREHVGISDPSMIDTTKKFNANGGKGVQTSFPDLATAQSGVNFVIAQSSTLQKFILHGAAGSEAYDTKCSPSQDFGHGYVRIIDRGGRRIKTPRRIGPLHCVYVLIAKNIFGVPYIEDAYPTES